MKNRLSTLLMVLLTAFMVQCKSCNPTNSDPVVSGEWTVVSVSSQVGTSASPAYGTAGSTVQDKFGQAIGGKVVLVSGAPGSYTFKKVDGSTTTGGSGAATYDVTTTTEGSVILDALYTLKYTDLTATSVTLTGNVTPVTKSTQNIHTIKLTR